MTLILAGAWPCPASAAAPKPGRPAPCRRIAARGLGLDRTLRSGVFEIRYTVAGKNAVSRNDDANANDVPDEIDDLVRQLDTAYDYYVHVLGLVPPLGQPRYRRAAHIEVLVKNMTAHSGLSFDEVVRETGRSDCELMMVINSRLTPDRNPTAAHELFHLFQYGYAMFKVPWYLEGMARWIEGVFRSGSDTRPPPSSAPIQCESVVHRGYGASLFWRSAAQTASLPRRRRLPRRLQDRRYVNWRAIIVAGDLTGGIVRPVLENLQKASLQISGDDLRDFDWPEDVQQSHRFDLLMCHSIEAALATTR